MVSFCPDQITDLGQWVAVLSAQLEGGGVGVLNIQLYPDLHIRRNVSTFTFLDFAFLEMREVAHNIYHLRHFMFNKKLPMRELCWYSGNNPPSSSFQLNMIFPGKELLSPDWFGSILHPCRHSSCGTALYISAVCQPNPKAKNEEKKEETHFKKKDKNEILLKKTIQAKINLQENFSRL